jgi:hypothetical protein
MAKASFIPSAKRGEDNLWLQPLDGGAGQASARFDWEGNVGIQEQVLAQCGFRVALFSA